MTEAPKPRTVEMRIRLSLADADAVLGAFDWMDGPLPRPSVPLYTGPVQNFHHALRALVDEERRKERRRQVAARRKTGR